MGKHLKGRHAVEKIFWANTKVAFLLWGLATVFTRRPSLDDQIGPILTTIVALFVIVGSLISLVGLGLSVSKSRQHRSHSFRVELLGLLLLSCGPITYMLAAVARANTGPEIRAAALTYAFAAVVMARTQTVYTMLMDRGSDGRA